MVQITVRPRFSVKVKADYEIMKIDDQQRIIFIVDLDIGNRSVTNDAENVVEEVHARCGVNYRIVYLDTVDRWDEMLHIDGKFIGFVPFAGITPSQL